MLVFSSLPQSSPTAAPRWRDYRRFSPRLRPQSALWQWLIRDGSLTQALIELADGELTVKILHEGYASIRFDEFTRLGLARPQQCWVREVVLRGKGQDWIFARTIIPVTHLKGDFRRLGKQGKTPLGAFLFSHRHLERTPFDIARIRPNDTYAPLSLVSEPVFARRSRFTFGERHMLVSEVYLPALERAIAVSNLRITPRR